jgi:hypothetical protein
MIDEYEYEEVEIFDIYQDDDFEDEYVYDLSMSDNTEQTFFGNSILVHNSVYISFDEVMNKLGISNEDDERKQCTKKLSKVVLNRIDKFNKFESMKLYNSENLIFFDSELLAISALFVKKKKYCAHMIEEDGMPCDKLLVKGLDIVRSSTPRLFRNNMKDIVGKILKGYTEKQTDEYSYNLYDTFKKWSLSDISLPKSCNNLGKYDIKDDGKILKFLKGTPQHMKGAILFNILRDRFGLIDLEPIKDSEKFRMIILKEGNPTKYKCIGYNSYLPNEFEIDDTYIDRPKMFSLGYTSPMIMIYEALGWNTNKDYSKKFQDIDDLFD